MINNYGTIDRNKPTFSLCCYTITAIGLVLFGGSVIIQDMNENGLTTERVTEFYGGWNYFYIILGIGVLIILYVIMNVVVLLRRLKNYKETES